MWSRQEIWWGLENICKMQDTHTLLSKNLSLKLETRRNNAHILSLYKDNKSAEYN